MTDRDLQILVKASIVDSSRKQKYLDVIAVLDDDEKLEYALMLWQILLKKVESKVASEIGKLIEENEIDDNEVNRIKHDAMQLYLLKMLDENEVDEMATLKDKLASL